MKPANPIRVLVVDDSAIVRKILRETLDAEPDIEVVGSAPDPYVARDKIMKLKPDVLTLDLEMPRMDGLTFLKKLMHYTPLPVIVISSIGQASCEAAMEALRRGAVEVLAKPAGPFSVGDLRLTLAMKVRAAAKARISRPAGTPAPPAPAAPPPPGPLPEARFHPAAVIAMGASTGGTEALETVIRALPKQMPGIVVVQHIPAGFSRAFANRLNQLCELEVKEAENGDAAVPGRVLIAPGDYHMLLRKQGDGYRVSVKTGPRVCYQRPSVDVMLTGMGADGAKGMLQMKQAGAWNLAQDEATCVVYGMPREAVRAGGVDKSLPLHRIPAALLARFAEPRRKAG